MSRKKITHGTVQKRIMMPVQNNTDSAGFGVTQFRTFPDMNHGQKTSIYFGKIEKILPNVNGLRRHETVTSVLYAHHAVVMMDVLNGISAAGAGTYRRIS
jgi:hypothetical protein